MVMFLFRIDLAGLFTFLSSLPILKEERSLGIKPQKVVRTDAATHAVPAWKMSTQGKTGRKMNLKN